LPLAPPRGDADVRITGRVVDAADHQPVGGVEVVFRGAAGEATTASRSDGSYALRVAPGVYRGFVRDDAVLSLGHAEPTRLPTLPSADTAGVPDEALMPLVVATDDVDGADLLVVRAAVVTGHALDEAGRPVDGAVLRAHNSQDVRPALATDIAETDRDGSFELRLPAGRFELEVGHPRFAGIATINAAPRPRIIVDPGERLDVRVVLAAGCVISGRVIDHRGAPSGDGAIELQSGAGELGYIPAGRVAPDGTFRWVTSDDIDLTLRAWPWKSPPSPGKHFTCRDGARFERVVFRLPDRRPDLEGVLVDRAGAPVAFAHVDLAPLEPGGVAQQERTDDLGRWAFFSAPAGRYRISAQAEGRGVAAATIAAPRDGIRLALAGTGRLEGTTPRLPRGSFELGLASCLEPGGTVPLPQASRLITITGGRFAVDDLPACELTFRAVWRGKRVVQHVAIPSDGVGHVELELGLPRDKAVHGVVRDADGRPVAGAVVTASVQGKPSATVISDASGAFRLTTVSGASLRASANGQIGVARVGGADVDAEQVDLVTDDEARSPGAP
jgi:hypothetical protein